MLITSEKVFQSAQNKGFAIPAPNFFDESSLRTYLQVAENRKLPVIASFAEVHTDFMEVEDAAMLGRYFGEKASVPVVLHLDHGMSYEAIVKAIKSGFTSVMIDASSDPFDENVKKTQEIVKLAHSLGVVVEAEIGHVGAGDNYENHDHTDSIYTDINEAIKFVEMTNVDSLAVSIGTAHGAYRGSPKINFDILSQLKRSINKPLVLHGGSSSGDDNLEKCALSGISKINIFTDLATAGHNNLSKQTPKNIFETKDYIQQGMYDCLSHYYDVFHTNKINK